MRPLGLLARRALHRCVCSTAYRLHCAAEDTSCAGHGGGADAVLRGKLASSLTSLRHCCDACNHCSARIQQSAQSGKAVNWREDPNPIRFSQTKAARSTIDDTLGLAEHAPPTKSSYFFIGTGVLLCSAMIYVILTRDRTAENVFPYGLAPSEAEMAEQQEKNRASTTVSADSHSSA
eukprot:m.116737 g.116737  ORF g.116737 m.116737 type:complete len:177 (-) comp9510_c0_seq1:53-583(-)